MRRAFTLVELLVVIGILAMLAAILFPVLAQAKGAAKRAECVSNVRRLSAAMLMYPDDHDEVYPKRIDGTDNEDIEQWIDMIFPYGRAGRDGKTSPLSKRSEFVPAPGLADDYGRKKITVCGYGMNGHLHNAREPAWEGTLVDSAATALIGDRTLSVFYTRPRHRARAAYANSKLLSPYELPCVEARTRHGAGSVVRPGGGGSTISFADGHVRFLAAEAIMTRLGVHPQVPHSGERLFYEGVREDFCEGGSPVGL